MGLHIYSKAKQMDEQFHFEEFPFRKLNMQVPRREFFHSLLGEVTGSASALNQKPTYRIADLGELPLKTLAPLTPALCSGCKFKMDKHFIYGKAPNRQAYIKLFPKDSAAHIIFQFFNHRLTIRALSKALRNILPMKAKESLLYVRGLFLFLAEEGFAFPIAGMPKNG